MVWLRYGRIHFYFENSRGEVERATLRRVPLIPAFRLCALDSDLDNLRRRLAARARVASGRVRLRSYRPETEEKGPILDLWRFGENDETYWVEPVPEDELECEPQEGMRTSSLQRRSHDEFEALTCSSLCIL